MPKANDLIGNYQLIRKLGAGGFGEVWLARDINSSTPSEVAVKTPLNSEVDLDALLQEATLWARASGHPNVLEFLDARVFDGQVVLVSEYAPDGSLTNWLRRHGERAPSVEAAVEMALGILAGLEHLHARSIIHRDVKPDNVLLMGATPRLADFGISRVLKSTSKSAVSAGTPVYMAPEAFNRRRNQQTDLW
jgi:eukaryotic-like serine/threonine-protein kinase